MADKDEEMEPQRRKRALLKNFYKQEVAAAPKGMPLDIDSSAFNVEMYMKRLRSKADLKTLLFRETQLGQEIKALDSEMQTLVYENYNKFLNATDTIRNMKSQVNSMEAEITSLTASMTRITQLSTVIDKSLSVGRDHINKLSSSHALLKKLQFLFELPARLRQCMELKAYTEAVGYYAKAAGVLDAYRNMESFKGIYGECQGIVSELVRELHAQMDVPNLPLRRVVECYELVRRLERNVASRAQCASLLARAKSQLLADRATQEAHLAADRPVAPEAAPGVDAGGAGVSVPGDASKYHPLVSYVALGNTLVLRNLAEWIMAYEDVFLPALVASGAVAGAAAAAAAPKPETARVDSEHGAAAHHLECFIKAEMIAYVECVVKHIQDHVAAHTQIPHIVQALEGLYVGVTRLGSLRAEADVEPVVSAATVATVRVLCRTEGLRLQALMNDALKTHAYKAVTAPLSEVALYARELCTLLDATVDHSLNGLRAVLGTEFANSNRYFSGEFQTRSVRRSLVQGLLLQTHSFCQKYAGDVSDLSGKAAVAAIERAPADVSSAFTVVLSRFCALVGERVFMAVTKTAATLFPAAAKGSDRDRRGAPAAESDDEVAARYHCEVFHATSLQLLARCVRGEAELLRPIVGAHLAFLTRECNAYPHGPSPPITALVDGLVRIDSVFAHIVDATGSTEAKKQSRKGGSAAGRKAAAARSTNLHTLFSEQVQIFEAPEAARAPLTCGVVKAVLKMVSEGARMATLGKCAAQQMQVDMEFLNRELEPIVSDPIHDATVAKMLQTACLSAASRCVDLAPLDAQDLADLLGEKKALLTSPSRDTLVLGSDHGDNQSQQSED